MTKKYPNPRYNPRLYPLQKEYDPAGIGQKKHCEERRIVCSDCGEFGHSRFLLGPDNHKRKCIAVAHCHFTRDMDKYRNANHIVKEQNNNGQSIIVWHKTEPGEVIKSYRLCNHKRMPQYVWDMFEQ
jgi:hypothetical protein